MNKVKIGFFSFTEITEGGDHRAYNEWHQLDHMPEQWPIPGIAHGQRWVLSPACRQRCSVAEGVLGDVHYLTLYLMTEPVKETLDEFFDLAQRLHRMGRFYEHRRSHVSGPLLFLSADAAPRIQISPEAVPYRPCRGVFVVVEEPAEHSFGERLDRHLRWLHECHVPELLAVDGVAGVCSFATDPRLVSGRWTPGERRITVCYLDGSPVDVAGAIHPLLGERWQEGSLRPVFAGPLETVVPWQWDWFDT